MNMAAIFKGFIQFNIILMKHIFSYLIIFILLPLLTAAQKVVSMKIDGPINPVVADFIHHGIQKAHNEKAECLLIHLNTPGGLLQSTRIIVSDILESPVPVVVYVAPGGAHSGSAGVFITLAAHVAAMAPGTNIVAAHPVELQGGMDTIMNAKATNDAAAFIRTIAEKRKRNLEWAEDAVRHSLSITESEALAKKVIDTIARTDQELLNQINGKNIGVSSGTVTLHTSNASIESYEMGSIEKILNIISDPNIAYILLMLGMYGLLFELYSPGAIFPGIIGVISLILAFYSMQTLPINYAGLALIISSVAVTVFFFLFVIGLGLKAQRAKPVTGIEGMISKTGESIDALDPAGRVSVQGEIWNAESVSGPISKGEKIRVTGIKNLKLYVELFNS